MVVLLKAIASERAQVANAARGSADPGAAGAHPGPTLEIVTKSYATPLLVVVVHPRDRVKNSHIKGQKIDDRVDARKVEQGKKMGYNGESRYLSMTRGAARTR